MPVIKIGKNTTGMDYTGIEDNWFWSDNPTQNEGAYTSLHCVRTSGALHRILWVKPDLSVIPSGATINSAKIYMAEDNWTAQHIHFLRVLVAVICGTQNNADKSNDDPDSSCWNERGSGTAWTTAGCQSDGNDRDSTVLLSFEGAAGALGYHNTGSAELADWVQDVVDGVVTNYGLIGEQQSDNTTNYFVSSEGADGYRIYFEIDYTSGGGSTTPIAVYLNQLRQQGIT